MNRKLCASLLAGAAVLCTLILTGGDLRMFLDVRAAIVIFGGSFATTLIRFPLSSIFHGLPLGAKFAFSLRRMSQRDLVDELAELAEVARKQGPIGLEKVDIEDPFRRVTITLMREEPPLPDNL